MASTTPAAETRGHNFEVHSYGLTPTQCFICNEFLNGFWQEAYQCQNCAINVHDTCRPLASATCFVTHRFKETSYMTLATCAACGQPMLGFWKQGFKCEDCGLDVHPTCRTQSSISACKAAVAPDLGPATTVIIKDEPQNQSGRRRSFLDKNGSQRGLAKQGSSNSLLQVQEPLPTDLDGVKKEIRKLHDENLESLRKLEEQWEKAMKPGLKAQRAQLQMQYDHLKLKQKEKQEEVVQLSAARDDAFRVFLKNFYQKYNPSKVKNVDSVVRHYGNGSCRERELFSELMEKYSNEPTAVALIEHERSFGVLSAGALEAALIELEDIAGQVSKSKSALATVRRDVYFAPTIPWLVKGGAEGMYAGFTSLWLEECTGIFSLNCAMCKGETTGQLAPGDDGYRPRISVQLSGLEDNAADPGWKFSARLEDMCLSGSALPISLSLRDADIAVQFDLSIEAQYDPPTSPDDPCGSWRVLDGGFKLKVHKFYLKTKNTGGLSIPDVVLGTMIQTFITLAFKKIIVLVMPPEVGTYMMAIHHHRTLRRQQAEESNGALGATNGHSHHHHHHHEHAQEDTGIWNSPGQDDPHSERFLKLQAKIKIKQTLDLDAVDCTLTEKTLDQVQQQKVLEALRMDKDQLRLMLLTQKELGLTFGSLWGNQNADWLSTIATTVAGTGQDLNRIPMQSMLDFVKYHRDFLDFSNISSGMAKSRRAYVCQRLLDLWQLAIDMVCEHSGGELPEAGIAGKMKRMVTQRLKTRGDVNLRSFDFHQFSKRLEELSKKEIYSEVEVGTFEVCLAVRSFIRAMRDTALRVIGKKKGSSALQSRMVSAANFPKKQQSQNGNDSTIAKDFAQAIEQDRAENKASLVPNFGKTLPVQIQRASDFALEKLRELQERYVDSVRLRVELVAGDGNYRAAANEIRLVAPVDVGLQIQSKLLQSVLSRTIKHGNDSEQGKWAWNRKVLVENGLFKVSFTHDAGTGPEGASSSSSSSKPHAGGVMVEALRRMGGKAAQAAEKDLGEFHVTASGLFAQMRTETGAVTDVLSVNVRPLADPDRVEVKALGAGAMRIHATIEKVESQGQFATLFHYVDDFLAAMSKSQPDLARARVLPKFVAGFAARDSFYIDTLAWINVRSESSAGDLVVHSSNHVGKRCVRVGLTHNLQDLIHDLFDLVQGATKISPKEKAS